MIKYFLILIVLLVLPACGSDLSKNAVASVNGECQADHSIKGNRGTNGWIYHKLGDPYYKRTNAEECFSSDADAQNAGYRKSKR